ncbi:hypothetical protein KBD71_02405 [Candidatus Woesebacteria bacterium]|nr:hypothetical protein [Candidatus Woesebacteria bacterium]
MKALPIVLILTIGFILINATAIAYKISTVPENPVHLHANFAVVLNDVPVDFSKPSYMTIQPCGDLVHGDSKKDGVHLHDQVGNVVHVHAEGITWNDFFESVQFNLGSKILEASPGATPQYFINGEKREPVVISDLIRSKDQLLVYVGSASAVPRVSEDDRLIAAQRFVGSDAIDYETGKKTSSTCSPQGKRSLWERFKIAFGLTDH